MMLHTCTKKHDAVAKLARGLDSTESCLLVSARVQRSVLFLFFVDKNNEDAAARPRRRPSAEGRDASAPSRLRRLGLEREAEADLVGAEVADRRDLGGGVEDLQVAALLEGLWRRRHEDEFNSLLAPA